MALELGTKAPEFKLEIKEGKEGSLQRIAFLIDEDGKIARVLLAEL